MQTLGIQNVLILDHHQDTLLYAASASTSISLFHLGQKKIHLGEIELKSGLFRLKKYQGETHTNLQPIIDKIKASDKNKDPWDFAMQTVHLLDMRIERIDENKEELGKGRLDPAHLFLTEVNATLSGISFEKDGIAFESESLSLHERSGLVLRELRAKALITDSQLHLSEMELQTLESEIIGELFLNFSSSDSDSLFIKTGISSSRLYLSELGYLAPAYAKMHELVTVSGEIEGLLSDLTLRNTELRFGVSSQLLMNGQIKGLPNVDSLWISADIKRFRSDVDDLVNLPVPKIEKILSKLPEQLKRLGKFDFSGDFIGGLDSFYAAGNFHTDLGDATANLDVVLGAQNGSNQYDGFLNLKELDIGTLLGVHGLGSTSSRLDVSIKERGKDTEADVKGLIDHLSYKGFDYRNVLIDGRLQESLFNGLLSIKQPEINLDFKGLVDLRNRKPKFDFEADLFDADLGALGLVSSMDSTSITGNVVASFEGDQIDDFTGKVVIQGLSYCKEDREYFFQDISLDSKSTDSGRLVELHSTPIDGTIDGRFKFADLKNDFIGLFDEVLPSIMKETPQNRTVNSNFGYAFVLKDIDQVAALFAPGVQVSSGTMVSGRLNAEKSLFTMNLNSDTISYDRVRLEHIVFEMERVADVAYVSITSDQMTWGDSLRFRDNYYTLNAYRDSLETDFTWSIADKDASGSVSTLSILHSLDSIRTVVFPSQIVLSGDYWLTQGESEVLYHDSRFNITPFTLSNGTETISVSGDIGKQAEDQLEFTVENFQLNHLNKFSPSSMTSFEGEVELIGHATSVMAKPTIVADLTIDEFHIGGERVGDIDLNSTWSRGEEFLLLQGGLDEDGRKRVLIDGKFFPQAESDNYDAELSFDEFDLELLNKLPLGAVSGLGGTATGQLSVKGKALEPEITGELDFKEVKIHVNYLNTDYTFSSEVKVRKNYIAIDYIPFEDENGNKGNLNGTVIHNNFRDWNYDLFAEFENLLVLNTTEAMNETFYGTVFGTGSVSLSGYDKQLLIEVFGKTEKNTVLELPLGNTGRVELDDFVYFKRTPEEDSLLAVQNKPTTGIELHIEAEVTPDAYIKLIFDEKIGDVVEGNGQGTLTMTLDKSGVFEMFGNFLILQGDYLFTLQNVVNKRFQVAPGSSVAFFGDPLEAELELTAIYRLRAPLSDLLPEYGDLYSNRVAVNCEMELDGQLFNPDIGFNISFPELDGGTETLAKSKINTEDELNRQVFSLLVLNKFLSSEIASYNDGIAGVANTGSEFASAQLSNWLSQISDDLDIGVNYRAGDNLNSEEIAVALTTQLFNDRLLLSGNFGVQGTAPNSNDRATSVIGDFRLEYIIMPDGRLRLKVFSESNDNTVLDLDQSASKQGVGLVFQKEFDGLFQDKK